MIGQVEDKRQLQELKELIEQSQRVVITCHVSPDGDALGSSLGLMHLLRKMGKKAHVVAPNVLPATLSFLPGFREVVVYTRQELFSRNLVKDADLVVCLDFNALSRIDKFEPLISECQAKKVLIDHHLSPDNFCDIIFSDPTMSSTCEYLFTILDEMGLAKDLTKEMAECIYTGMMTDTGNFSYNSNRPSIYRIIVKLLELGVDKDRIYNLGMNVSTVEQLRINGHALSDRMMVFPEKGAALIYLTKEDLVDYHYQKGDTEGLVNKPLSVPAIYFSVYLREDNEYVKVSMRSQGDFAVNTLCSQYFNGGGHKNAAGGEFYGTLDEAIQKVTELINEI